MKTKLKIIGVVILAVIAGILWYVGRDTRVELTQEGIIFPSGGETLVAGQTYVLRWQGETGNTQIFLVDTDLKPQGASVSISDRVYGVENDGSYDYMVPQSISPGTYEFQIGNETSKIFQIVSE